MESMKVMFENALQAFDPWKQQVVIGTKRGEWVIELDADNREFNMFGMDSKSIAGLDNIKKSVEEMLANNEIVNVFVDSL